MRSRFLMLIWVISLVLLSGVFIFREQINATVTPLITHNESPINDGLNPAGVENIDNGSDNEANTVASIMEEDAPLVYTLPTPGEPPISYWRPPLYEAPWALTPHDHFLFTRPIAADTVNWPLANYRYGYFFPGTDIVHTGIDIPTPRGTPIHAAASGTVIWAGYGLYYGNDNPDDPYGLAVSIEHDFSYDGDRLITVYAHMDRINVEVGQEVQVGDQLGVVGMTGFTTGPHLHFEVRLASNSFFKTRNPELWLTPPQGWGVMVAQLRKSDYNYINYQEVYVRNKETNQLWMVRSYGPSSVNRDDFYQENLALSDLPAGDYEIYFEFEGTNYKHDISIHPGAITYFTFRPNMGFNDELPAINTPESWQNLILSDEFDEESPLNP